MLEQLHYTSEVESFDAIVEAERARAELTFQASIDAIEVGMSDEEESELSLITMGKMTGCQDTGGGGHEWEKIEAA